MAERMPDSPESLAERVLAGDRRALARAISVVESGEPGAVPMLKRLFPRAGKADVIGITGSAGTGKSTLVEKLAGEYRRAGARVGIIAVDPTSPFTGGAILGDRIRMQALSGDEGVYIRSMATRGQLGGLSPSAYDVAMVLDAAGCSVVFVETVGVGQDEVEVAQLAGATVVLLTPGMGDDVQAFKAGVMEIADLFVVNKADLPGAERVEQELAAMLSVAFPPGSRRPSVLKTAATTGDGIAELRKALSDYFDESRAGADAAARRRRQTRARLLSLLREKLLERVVGRESQNGLLGRHVDKVVERASDPYSVVEEVMQESGLGPR
jgi:GTPase